jgi:hypothetical protein
MPGVPLGSALLLQSSGSGFLMGGHWQPKNEKPLDIVTFSFRRLFSQSQLRRHLCSSTTTNFTAEPHAW